jgi:hypothetical protein
MPNTWENNALYNHYKVSTISGRPLEIKTTSGVSLAVTEGFSVPAYDYISLTYSGTTLTGVVYKTGGAGGTTLATLTLAYDGSNNLTSVTKS